MKALQKFVEQRLETFTKLQLKRSTSNSNSSLIRVQVRDRDNSVHLKEVNQGTSAVELLKGLPGIKECLFAEVKYADKEVSEVMVVDTDQMEENKDENQKWNVVDLSRPILHDCEIQMVNFEQGKKHFWHSSSHMLGSAIEKTFADSLLTMGPSTKDGFFYDFYSPSGRVVLEQDYALLEENIKEQIKQKLRFERLVISKEEALCLFNYNKYKVHLINSKVPDGNMTSVYKIGNFIDLCTGPHIQHTGLPKAFAITKHSAAYWLGDANNDHLQRVYGVAFPEQTLLQDYMKLKEEALKRDHRVVGQNQSLFFFNKLAPGSAFFLNHGTKIYNKLVDLMRFEYLKRGYQEVITPNMFHIDLWKISGHYKNYKENLFMLKNHEKLHENCETHETFGLKPMNCPGHCLMFKNTTHSYKDLPIRFADFGVLHRNEISGALTGLTRVRRFQQDDAHIFCRRDQIESEVQSCIEFLDHIYGLFGFKWDIFLSTRPENSMGSDQQWEEAESQLKNALDKNGKPWKLNKGDGAFYGPKIDIIIYDALDRAQQCGTIQLDFQLPIRFNLQYKTASQDSYSEPIDPSLLGSEVYPPDEFSTHKFEWKEQPLKAGHERPVIIHRAILGSVERFMAILTEHLAGKWPLWLSPRQVVVCPISDKYLPYATKVYNELKSQGFEIELDDQVASINKKVRNAQIAQFNYILILGDKEESTNTVEVRQREAGGDKIGKMTIEEFIQSLKSEYPPGVPLPQRIVNGTQ